MEEQRVQASYRRDVDQRMDGGIGHQGDKGTVRLKARWRCHVRARMQTLPAARAGPENAGGKAEVNNMDLLGLFGDGFEL